MIALAAEDFADLRRWIVSAAIVVLAHGGIAAATVNWRESIEPAEPAAAIVIEFAPMLVAPAMQQSDIPPGPEQVMSEAAPEQKIEQRPAEEPPPEVKPAPNPELAVEPPQEVKQEVVQEPRAPAPMTSAPQALPVETAPIVTAPTEGQFNAKASNPMQSWTMQVFAMLKRNLRYPPSAASRGQSGGAQVAFSLDRQGRVVESRIMRSSGVAVLDAEALAVVQRAAPFPLPPKLAGERVDLMAPIHFNLK